MGTKINLSSRLNHNNCKMFLVMPVSYICWFTDIMSGEIVVISVQRFMQTTDDTDIDSAFDKIESVAGMTSGSLLLRMGTKYDAFSMIFVKGNTH